LGLRLAAGLMLVMAALGAPAHAGDRSTLSTQFEVEASTVARAFAGPAASIRCASAARWRALATRWGFDPQTTWALTPRHRDSATGASAPDGYAEFSPRACRLAGEFLALPTEHGTRTCRHGSQQGECDDWASKLVSVHVLTHEAMHLAGVMGEAEADCLAAQLDALVAEALGADRRFGRLLAREYWTYYYPSQSAAYRSRECHDGGALDLFPARRGWPTPAAGYPRDVTRLIAAFARPGV
jgi:hypothetical protein